VVNRCLGAGQLLGEPCNYVNEDSAAFCTRCGSHTAYHQAGLVFTTYPENKVLQKDEVDEMNWFFHPFFYD
jgi:RNA polymerase subunit RPABC4/transcription elongation factor Spt4